MTSVIGEMAYWSIETERLLEQLQTTTQGLTSPEAAQRLTEVAQLKSHRPYHKSHCKNMPDSRFPCI